MHLRGLPWEASVADVYAALERAVPSVGHTASRKGSTGAPTMAPKLALHIKLLADKDGRSSGAAVLQWSASDAAAAAAAGLSHTRVGGRWLEASIIGSYEAAELCSRSDEALQRASRLASQAFGQERSTRPRPPPGRREFVVVCHETPSALAERGKFELNNLPEGRVDLLARCLAACLFYSHGVRQEARVWLLLADARRVVCCDGGRCKGLRPDERCLAAAVGRALAGHPLPGWSTREAMDLGALLVELTCAKAVLEEPSACENAAADAPEAKLGEETLGEARGCAGTGAVVSTCMLGEEPQGEARGCAGAGAVVSTCMLGEEPLGETPRLLVMHEAGQRLLGAALPRPAVPAHSTVTVLGDHLGFTEAEEEILELRGAVRVSLGPVPMLTSQCITIVQWLLDNE